MSLSFTNFSDAVMAALASRSHEWMEWEIRECEQIAHILRKDPSSSHAETLEIPSRYVSVSVSLPTQDVALIGHACLKYDPLADSPSASVTRVLEEARARPTPVFHFSDWRSNLGSKNFYDFEQDLVSDPARFLKTLQTEIADRAGRHAWTLEGTVSSFKIRNSRGLLASFTETEVGVKISARTVYNGRRYDPKTLRRQLELFEF